MSRMRMTGFEAGVLTAEGGTVTGSPAASTTNPRSGQYAMRVTSALTAAYYAEAITTVLGTVYYARTYIYVPSGAISNASPVLAFYQAANHVGSVYLAVPAPNTDPATIHLAYASGITLLNGGGQTTTITRDTWHCLELSVLVPAAGSGTLMLRVDETDIITSTQTIGNTAITICRVGWIGSSAPGVNIDFDDFGINDNGGTDQLSWLGEGKIVNMLPASDSARGAAWKTGNSVGTASLFDAVDNEPPVGVAEASATATSEIMNNSAGLNEAYDANMQTFAAVGITDGSAETQTYNTVTSASSIAFGADTTAEKQAQSITPTVSGYLAQVLVKAGKSGSPSDNYVISICSDANGPNEADVLGSVSKPGSAIVTVAATNRFSFTQTDVYLVAGRKYWIVASRSGALDAANNYSIGTDLTNPNQSANNYYITYGTTGWFDPGGLTGDLYHGFVISMVRVIEPFVQHAEGATTTGTKAGSVEIVSNPVIAATNFNYGDDLNVSAGTFPTGWRTLLGSVSHSPSVTPGTAPVMRVRAISGQTATRKALVCYMAMVVEYRTARPNSLVAPSRSSRNYLLRR